MIQTILILVFAILVSTWGIITKQIEDSFIRKEVKTYGRLGLIVLLLITLALSTISIIPTGEVGVKTICGVVSGSVPNGVNITWPWEDITTMNTKVQLKSFKDLSASTKDGQIITNIVLDVNYRLSTDSVESLFSNVGLDYQSTVMHPLATQLIKNQLAKYNAEDLINTRNQIVSDIFDELSGGLEKYGILIENVSLTNYDFSEQYNQAIEAKAVATKKIETAKMEQEQAKIEAETNQIKSQALTNEVLTEKMIDAIKEGKGTYIIDTSNLSISVK